MKRRESDIFLADGTVGSHADGDEDIRIAADLQDRIRWDAQQRMKDEFRHQRLTGWQEASDFLHGYGVRGKGNKGFLKAVNLLQKEIDILGRF